MTKQISKRAKGFGFDANARMFLAIAFKSSF